MSAEEIHHSHQESQRPQQENATALGGIATQDFGPGGNQAVERSDDGDGRWDHAKAQTMAAVLQEHPQDLVWENGELVRGEDGHFKKAPSKLNSSIYDQAQYSRQYSERYQSPVYPQDREKIDGRRAELLDVIQNPDSDEWDVQDAQAELKSAHEQLDQRLSEAISVHAVYYDLNPERFAEMPTGKFMDAVKQFERATENVEATEDSVDTILRVTSYYEDMLEKAQGRPYRNDLIAGFAKGIFNGVETDAVREYRSKITDGSDKKPRSFSDLSYEIERMIENSIDQFTMSPKDIITKHIEILKEIAGVGSASLNELRATKQRLEDEARAGTA